MAGGRRIAYIRDAMIDDLYSAKLLKLAANLPRLGRLPAPHGSAEKVSKLCGSRVLVDVTVDGDRVADFAQEVKACALGQASAAIAGAQMIGRTRAEVERARDELRAMLKEGGPVPTAPFAGYEVLEPARDYKNRHASILLVFEATAEAMAAAEAAA